MGFIEVNNVVFCGVHDCEAVYMWDGKGKAATSPKKPCCRVATGFPRYCLRAAASATADRR